MHGTKPDPGIAPPPGALGKSPPCALADHAGAPAFNGLEHASVRHGHQMAYAEIAGDAET